jgi:hypothetical protein
MESQAANCSPAFIVVRTAWQNAMYRSASFLFDKLEFG